MEQHETGTGPREAGLQPGAVRGTAQDAAGAVAQPSTGDARVDEALRRLDELAGLPVAEHPAVFEQVHRRLAEALGELGPDAAGH